MAQAKKNNSDDSLGIEWVDEVPDPQFGHKGALAEERQALVQALRANQGKWAKLPRSKAAIVGSVRSGYGGFSPQGAFEVRTRNTSKDGKTADVYLRYVGDGEQPEE